MNITNRQYQGLPSLPCDTEPTMAYIPFQVDASMYDEEYALCQGTLFPNIDKPFLRGSECCD